MRDEFYHLGTIQPEYAMDSPRILNLPQPPNYLQLPAFERRRVVSDLGAIVRRAQSAGCDVQRRGNDVTITVPDGVAFDLRGLR